MNVIHDQQASMIQDNSAPGSAQATRKEEVEKKLRESEERYRSLVMATAQIVETVPGNGLVEDIPSWRAFTGQSLEEVRGWGWANAIHPDDRETVASAWSESVATSSIYQIEYRIQRYDGAYRTFSVTCVPIYETDGCVREWVALCTDITERKEAENKLLEGEKRYRDLADAMPQIVWTARPDGYLDYYNSRWFDYTGFTENESYAAEGWKLVLHPDDVELCVNRWYSAIQTGEPFEIEYRFKRASDGSYRWHLGRALPVRSTTGQVIKWFGTCTDIDDQKRSEELLRARAHQQAAVAELGQHALEGIDLSVLLDKAVTLVAETFEVEHCTIKELLPDGKSLLIRAGTGWKDGVVGSTILGAAKNESQAGYTLASNEPVIVSNFRTETRFSVAPLMQEYALTSSVSVIIVGQERPFGALIAYTTRRRTFTEDDIHFLQSVANVLATAIERRRAETELARALAALQIVNDQLEHINKIQSDFVSITSHEFRTTLTSIQGFSELIRDEEFSFQDIKEYAADINADARRLSRMISELLDLNRMKSGKMSLNREQVDLNGIIMDVVDRIRSTTSHHRLRLQLDETLPPLLGDRDKLTQVVTNLLTNAIKYSPGGGEILLGSTFDSHAAHVYVQDSGMGIPPDALERVFESYARIESGATKYIQGTGLGLPIVRQIVQMHDGKTWAESTLGVGSIFHFTIPLLDTFSHAEESIG